MLEVSNLRAPTLYTNFGGSRTLTLEAKIVSGKLTIKVDVDESGVPSSTGKTLLHVSTGGFISVPIVIDKKPARLNLMVTTQNK